MVRPYPQSPPPDYGRQPQPDEWHALRGELVALLDQVESQVARTNRMEIGYPELSERVRDLRYQAGQADPEDRHREALRSVRRAVDRFNERDDPGYALSGHGTNPQDNLRTAIHQIRSRYLEPEARSVPPPLDGLGAAAGISARLERLETELRTQARTQTGGVREIGDQMAQLSQVIELLAGAVGETGQVKRLETQIAGLATLVSQGARVDLSPLTGRLDDVSATVGRLADLQGLLADRVAEPAQREDMGAIEQGVRSIYDRMDAIEKHYALAPEDVDRLSTELARVAEAMRNPAQPRGLIASIDALTKRVGDIESRNGDVTGLKSDIAALRAAVIAAVEPRFAAIEQQLETLAGKITERPEPDGVTELGAQVEQVLARIDQTGEQLGRLVRNGAPEDFSRMRNGIREVNDRLARLETSLAEKLAPPADPPPPGDAMPKNPVDAAPVTGEPFDAVAPPPALGEAPNIPPVFDSATVERPPRPISSFDRREPLATIRLPEVVEPPGTVPEPVSADAFIAAARRATQRPSPALPEAPAPSEGFLARHRRSILLGVGLVALSALSFALLSQPLGHGDRIGELRADIGTAPDLRSPLSNKPASSVSGLSAAPRIMLVDSLVTGGVDPAAARRFAPRAVVPSTPKAFTSAAVLVAPAMSLATNAVAMNGEFLPASAKLESPVKLALPPAGLGPELLRHAAADGDARAQFEVAAIYTEGRAIAENLAAAAVWYERAAAQGFAPAQYRLANLYENGRGVAQDLAQAKLWYQRAAEAGNRMSMHNLAALYASGDAGEQDFGAAAAWFEQAAQRGMRDSQFNLGMLYARGLGVPQSLEVSYKWFALAAAQGDTDAAKTRDSVARALDAKTIARVSSEVAAWKPAPIDLAANFAPIGTWSQNFDPGTAVDNPDVVRSVQMALGRLGYDIGTPDGVAGPSTTDAIKDFERATGMSESGAINPRLLAVLGSQPV